MGRGQPGAGFGQGPGQVWLSPTPADLFWGLKSWGKSPPTKLQGLVKRDRVWDHEFAFRDRKPGAPNPPSRAPRHPPPLPASIKCGRLGDASSPPAHRRAQVGGAPGSPPSPAPPPPHLRRAAPCSAPGRPQRSTGAPPGSSPRSATRSRPARPGPASAAPLARPAPVRPEWAAQRGGGVGGASPPRARTRAGTPRHARPTRRTRGLRRGTQDPRPPAPPLREPVGSGLGRGRGSPSTPTRAPGPAAAGHCSSTKGRAPRRPPFPLRFFGRSLPRKTHSPASESRARRRGSAAPPPPQPLLPGPCAPG